jgi:hypothetical protein
MRRIALILVLVAFVAGASGCCMNWSDPMHPTVCPVIPKCDGRVPCNQRPDYSQRGSYP